MIATELNCLRIKMKRLFLAPLLLLATPAQSQPIPDAKDMHFPGTMTLNVDATDTARGIFRVNQTIPVWQSGPMVLLFPEWLPGSHAPRGQIEKLAGLVIKTGGKTLQWKRDAQDVYAFHINVPSGARQLDVSFQFLSATEDNQGRIVVTPEMMNLQPNSVSLYPAGYATRRIPVSMTVTWPAGWKAATALRPVGALTGNVVKYQTVDYETLVDSPIFAGKHFRAEPLGQGVMLNIVADDAKFLAATPAQIDAHKRLVDQAIKAFGARQFDHYDFLLALTDQMGSIGLEHHRSSENGVNPEYFTDWNVGPGRRNLLPHEFAHSWIGKYRRPAGQMVSDFRTPLVNDLLWAYEGQDQFWGYVLGARSGLFSKQETLDALASIAANQDNRPARDWRDVADTTRDPIITARRPKGWVSYQRSEDYYNEGLLIWLEMDGMIRAKTAGAKSIDDFARVFLGGTDGDYRAKGYSLDEIAATLNSIAPHDWKGFITQRLEEKAASAPLNGLELGGYRLTYVEEPSSFIKDNERRSTEVNLSWSLGMVVGKGGHLNAVIWDGLAFNAGLTVASEILAVNGRVYSDAVLRDAVTAAKGGTVPIRLIIKNGREVKEVSLPAYGGHRYPKLVKIGDGEGGIDRLLAPR
jgi:predicted metalloprotease with PDZ domain